MYLLPLVCILLKFLSNVEGLGLYALGDGFNILRKELEAALHLAVAADKPKIETRWIDQPLDHFDKSEKRIWLMRYFERLDLYKPGGPVYVFIGGEGEAHPGFLRGGMIYDLANQTNGAMFMSEHRYYGKSMPLKNKGVKNLKYLSAWQALADLARLIERIKLIPTFGEAKVVVIGGSYPGNLAAWFRLHYPHLADAALASSAPVLAKTNFYQYLETVSDDYEQYGTPGCHDFVRNLFQSYEESFKTPEGIKKLKKDERICEESDLTKPENQQLFVYAKAGYYMVNAQYGSVAKIQRHCERLMNESNKFDNFELGDQYSFALPEELSIWDRQEECYELDFDEIIEEIREGGSWLTSWVYQMCAEFSYAKSTSSSDQPFGNYIPISTFYKICSLSFGSQFNEKAIEKVVRDTNKLYGGLKPNVTKVIFANGELDPWHRLGVLEDVSYDAPAKFIPRSSHCLDLLPDRKGDPDELIEARKYIRYLIKSWIGIEDCSFLNKNSTNTNVRRTRRNFRSN